MHPRARTRLLLHAFLVLAITVFALPLAWAVGTSFKPPEEYYQPNVSLLPRRPTLEHYIITFAPGAGGGTSSGTFEIEARGSIGRSIVIALGNSVTVTALTIGLTLLLATPMAYAFARFRFRGKRNLGLWVLSTRMMPPISAVVPLFIVLRDLQLLDTVQGLAMVYAMANLPFAVWSLKGTFEAIPPELEEAALVDGDSRWSVIRRITLPLAAGGLVATTMLIMFLTWSEFLFAAVLTQRDAVTLPVALSLFRQDRGILWGPMAATIVVSSIPIALVVIVFQRYLVRGLTAGGVK